MAQPKKLVRIGVVVALVAAALASVPFGFSWLRRRSAGKAWTRFAACVGGPRLKETDSVEVRVRRMSLNPTAKIPRNMDGEPWPDRCSRAAEELERSWAVRSLVPEIEDLAGLASLYLETEDIGERGPDLELLWATADGLPWDDAVAAGTEPAPEPVTPIIDQAELRSLRRGCAGYVRLTQLGVDVQPRDHLQFARTSSDPKKNLCTIGASPEKGAFGQVRCGAGDTSKGPWLVSGTTLHEAAAARGKAAELDAERLFGDSARFIRVLEGRALQSVDDRLVATRLLDKAPWLGAEEILGEAKDYLSLQSCRTKTGTAIVVRAASPKSGLEDLDVYFMTDRSISKPQRLRRETAGGRGSTEKLGVVSIACGDDDVRVSWASGSAVRDVTEHSLQFARCTKEGCSTQSEKITGLAVTRSPTGTSGSMREPPLYPVESPYVLDLGEKAALLWEARGAVYARVGPKDALQNAPTQLIVEAYRPWVTKREVPGAAAIAMQDVTVVVRGDTAIALLPEHVRELQTSYSRDSVFPVTIRADGTVRALLCEDAP